MDTLQVRVQPAIPFMTFSVLCVFKTENTVNRNKLQAEKDKASHYLVFTLAECHVYAITEPTNNWQIQLFPSTSSISSPHIVCEMITDHEKY